MANQKADQSNAAAGFLRPLLILLMFALFTLLAVAASAWAQYGSALWFIIWCLSFMLLVIVVVVHVRMFHFFPTKKQYESDHQVVSIAYKELRDDSGNFSLGLTAAHYAPFVTSLVEPASGRGRIVEEIRPLKRALRQRVSATVVVDSTPEDTEVLYPLMTPVKGALQDDLHVQVNADGSVPTLSYYEYLLLVAKLLSSLLSPAKPLVDSDCAKKLEEFEEKAFSLIARRGELSANRAADLRSCMRGLGEIAEKLNAKNGAAEEASFVKLVISLVDKLSKNYVIVAILPKESRQAGRIIVSYERYLIPVLALAKVGSVLLFLRDRLRMLMGTRPFYLDLPLGNASLAQSYHLQVYGPDGTHLALQELTGHEDVFAETNTARSASSPYKRFRKRLGQGYLHLYMRSVPADTADQLRLKVRFYETPPGSMAPAMVAACASFALIYLAAVMSSIGKSLGSDFPALLLAFPAVAAVIVGFDRGVTQLISGTLASRTSSFLTIFNSLLGSGLYMAQSADRMKQDADFHLLFVSKSWWQVLVACALLNFVFATYVWISRTFSFYWLAARSSADLAVRDGV